MQGENVAEHIAEVRRANEELRRTRAELLVDHGYPADYTEVRYECPLCGDSGFVDARMCVCMKKKLVEAGFEASPTIETIPPPPAAWSRSLPV